MKVQTVFGFFIVGLIFTASLVSAEENKQDIAKKLANPLCFNDFCSFTKGVKK